MKRPHFRLIALLVATLALSLLLSSCDLEELFSFGKKDNAEPLVVVQIQSVRYDGDSIFITYEDGFERTTSVEELALSYRPATTVSVGGGLTGAFSGSITLSPDASSDSTSDTPMFSIGTTMSEFTAGAINSPGYVYKNGALSGFSMETVTVSETIQLNETTYASFNSEIAAYVRANLKSATVLASQTIVAAATGTDSEAAAEEVTVTIPVSSIRTGGFADLPLLTSITIPVSVKSIASAAFYNSPNLTEIIYEGTVEEWNLITKQDGWDYGAAQFTVHCSDGDIAPAVDAE